MPKLVQISRDPFAREDILREAVPASALHSCDTCKWCGQRNRFNGLFRYYVHRDGLYTKPEEITGLFCSKGCMVTYHGD